MGRIDKKPSYFDIRLNGLKGLGFDIKWFKSYLSNRKQYMILDKSSTNKLEIKCDPRQGSILDLLLFSIHMNNLAKASPFIGPIMFANNINLFHSNSSIWQLLATMNDKLRKLAQWFNANKVSLNPEKTKYIFFTNPRKEDYIPL